MNYEDYKNTVPYPCMGDDDYKAGRAAYRAETARLEALFKNDFFKELDIETNPKKDLLFGKAWDMGHSAGWAEVMSYGDELVDLIK